MIRDDQLPELASLRAAEKGLPFRTNPSFADLVVAADNNDAPVHRWFRLKESFSPRLLASVLPTMYAEVPPRLCILDPFAGVGTTLLSAQELRLLAPDAHVVGIERNPFIAFAARTKLNWKRIDVSRLVADGERAIQAARELSPPLPSLSSIRTGRCISQRNGRRIVAMREAIRRGVQGATADALTLGLAASIERLSKTRKDGRALRIVDRDPTRMVPTLRAQWGQIVQDCLELQEYSSKTPSCLLLEGDGRNPVQLGVQEGSVDLIFTSPPYPNNIDYSEVYKLELWLLGFIDYPCGFLDLRRQTFRSHPTCALPSPPRDFIYEVERGHLNDILGPILARAADDGPRLRLFTGYFSDMWVTLRNMFLILRPGGYAVFVVGNSLHGGDKAAYLIPTDLAIARMAQCLGFQVCETIIARNLKRRLTGNHFLRESIIILKKADARKRQTKV